MASGSIGATSNNQYVVGRLDWNSAQNVAGNYSTVNAYLYMWRNNSGYTTTGSGTWTITINGTSYSTTTTKTLTYNNTSYIIYQVTGFTVPHNADGTKSITISATGGIPSTSYTATYCSGTANLGTIPRASHPTITVNPIPLDGSTSTTIQGHRASTSFTHNYYYAFGSIGKTLIASGQNDYTWTPPQSLMNQIPSATSGSGTIYCDTYNGGTYIGSNTVGFTVTVPSNIKPTFTSVVPSERVSAVTTVMGSGVYVKTKSNVRFTISGATGTYGSTIVSGTITFNGTSHTVTVSSGSGYYETGVLNISGYPTYTAYVTDSRGRTSNISSEVDIIVRDYSPPRISSFSAQRCLSTGVLNDLGTYTKISRVASANSLLNGTEKNTITCNVYYKARTSGTWILCTSGTNPPSNPIGINVSASSSVASAVTGSYTYGNATPLFPITTAYDWKVDIIDKFNVTTSTLQVPTGVTVMSWSQDGVGIGKVWSKGALDVGGIVYTNNDRLVLRDNALEEHSTNGNASVSMNYLGYGGGVTQFRDVNIYNGKSSLLAQFIGSTGNFNLPNAMINNLIIGGSSGNRYSVIPIVDAGGVMEIGKYLDFHEGDGSTADADGRISCTLGKLTSNYGWGNLGKVSAYSWSGAIASGATVTLTHNLGYNPIVCLGLNTSSGAGGNHQLTYQYYDTNTVKVGNYNSGANTANCQVYLF